MKSSLSSIPPIIEYLQHRAVLDSVQASIVRDALDKNEYPGKFAGQIAISKGFISRELVLSHMADRALLRATAAVEDMRHLRDVGDLQLEPWQRAHFGNSIVNERRSDITKYDGAAVASNMAALLVYLSAQQPRLAKDESVFEAVLSAKAMAEALVFGHSSFTPIRTHWQQWLELIEATIRHTAIAANVDEKTVEEYITNRGAELRDAIATIL